MKVLDGIGGGLGRRVGASDTGLLTGRSLAPVVLLSVLPVILAITRQGYCIERGWGDKFMVWRGCTSDLPLAVGKVDGLGAYLTSSTDLVEPPVAGLLMALSRSLAPSGTEHIAQRGVLGVWVVIVAALLAVAVWLVATDRGHPRANPWQVALAPVAAWSVLLGPDLLAVVLATAGVWAWGRRRTWLAGGLLGVAVLAGPHALIVAAVLALIGARGQRARDLGPLAGGLGVGMLAAAIPFLAHPATLTQAVSQWWSQLPAAGASWYIFSALGEPIRGLPSAAFTLIGAVLAIGLAYILVLGTGSRQVPVAPLIVVALVVTLALGKTFPVQASLWLVPFVALSGIRWRDHLIWAACEVVHLLGHTLYAFTAYQTDRALPAGWYAVSILIRLGGLAWLAYQAWLVLDADAVPEPGGPPEQPEVPEVEQAEQPGETRPGDDGSPAARADEAWQEDAAAGPLTR